MYWRKEQTNIELRTDNLKAILDLVENTKSKVGSKHGLTLVLESNEM